MCIRSDLLRRDTPPATFDFNRASPLFLVKPGIGIQLYSGLPPAVTLNRSVTQLVCSRKSIASDLMTLASSSKRSSWQTFARISQSVLRRAVKLLRRRSLSARELNLSSYSVPFMNVSEYCCIGSNPCSKCCAIGFSISAMACSRTPGGRSFTPESDNWRFCGMIEYLTGRAGDCYKYGNGQQKARQKAGLSNLPTDS